ncbi:MAG: hypothetical protein IPM02_06140 [Betaproteobacteria bacterium]|nr:hypothetical protein [Betaproteobacteria bacterium]
MCEEAGIPSVSLVCEGFIRQAAATSIGLGLPSMPVALVPGHVGAQSDAELRRNIAEVTSGRVVDSLMRQDATHRDEVEPRARDIVFSGGLEEVNDFFYDREWSDGLPFVPPTVAKIEAFLRCTDRSPDEILGVVLPDNRAATVWSVAVNGVMAGCRPEYMPVLVTLIEAMVDPVYGVEHSGNTPGSESVIILNGPVIKRLGFNCTEGVLRDGYRPNTSVGRFWRLYLRNVAGFLLHKTDKPTFGNTWRVVAAENEDALARIGWKPLSVEQGFAAGDDTVTIARYTGGNVIASLTGSTPEEVMPILADAVLRQTSWQLTFTVGNGYGNLRPLILLSPILAETIARAGWSSAMRSNTSSTTRGCRRINSNGSCATGSTSRSGTSLKRRTPGGFRNSSMSRTIRSGWCRWCSRPRT